jgi:short-subunit dehydrogenase
MRLKELPAQVIVITGATSGIGLATARMAAENGAKVVLAARNEEALHKLANEINESGGNAVYSAGDAADETSVRKAAEKAVKAFGRIDTWVNNAGGSIYGRIMDVPTEDLRRLFETNLWGVVNGSRVAVENLRENGGALINVGSEVSDIPLPLQSMYAASKHAVKGFTDGLRMELEADDLPISVTLIKPTAINTPFPQNARNYLPYEPQLPQPLYAPELVAEAILHCAQNPKRDFLVGGMAKLHSSLGTHAPRLNDKMMELTIDSMQNSGELSPGNRPDGLYETNSDLSEYGDPDRFTIKTSLYQKASLHPLLVGALAVGGGLAIGALIKSQVNGRSTASSGEATY